jgi:hypothetical protein
MAREPGSGQPDHKTVSAHPAAVQRVFAGMAISHLPRNAWGKLITSRNAARAAAADKATARDVAKKQILMQRLAEQLGASRDRRRK